MAAKKRRKTVEAGDGDFDGSLAFGLGEDDRTTDAAVKREKPAPAKRRTPAKTSKSRKAKGKPKRRGGGSTLARFAGWATRKLMRVAMIAILVIGVGGVGVFGYFLSKLPPLAELEVPSRPATVRILAENGTLITTRGEKNGEALTLDEMPPYLPEAVIAIEDRRFYWHYGIDPIGLMRALYVNWTSGNVVQGGSTITQQLAKNLFLKPERTIERKIQEVVLALWLEGNLSKQRILELYLNRVYLGGGAYGVDAASLRYFGKSARNINLAEAAMLAGLLKAPGRYAPTNDPAAAESRATLVLEAMHDQGYIDGRDASLAMSAAIRPVRDVAGGSGRYVADWVMDLLPGYVGKLDRDVTVETTIDLRLQTAAAYTISESLGGEGEALNVSQGALVALDRDGAVRAMVGGRDYAKSPFNRALDARRQPGSAFKPFVYLTALEAGMTPETVRSDQPVSIGGWRPKNYTDEYRGPVTLQTALAQSLNTVSAQLIAEVGASRVAATAHRLGIASPLNETPSLALGTSEVSLLELTGAYVPFANGGSGVIPHVIERIATVDGEVLYERDGAGPGRVVDPLRVGMMNAMMRQTLEMGTGRKAAIANWPAAGKTGTSQDFRDAWFIGYTGELVAGVWFGNDNGKPTKKMTGGSMPAVAWQHFMNAALDGKTVVDLPGDYRFRDPVVAGGGLAAPQPASVAQPSRGIEDLVGTGPVADAAAPIPPADIGTLIPPPEKKVGFFKRLFGGG
jgi:penicillin-binding protein 1A